MILICLLAALTGCAKGEPENSLTVFNYGLYIDESVLSQFEDETGIRIKYEEAPTPEELYTKYKSGAIKYDVLCTSEYMLQRLINEGELKEIDFSDMQNVSDIGEEYWEFTRSFDPENKYVMPYFWGTVGLLYDKTKVHGDISSWDVIFNGEYAGDFIMPNSMRDAYATALKYLGYSLNTTDEGELREAQELLLSQKKDVSAYLVDEARDEVIAGNAAMAVVYSGEAYYAYEENHDFAYCLPEEGTNLWIDCWGVTRHCENVENAKKFLDFLCREDIAWANYEEVKYASPVKSVMARMSEEGLASDAINPSPEKLAKCEVFIQLPEETTDLLSSLWKELKAQ
ncbi:MAG TPA: spermidine/putrescine ABC transporter substrate-binding protein [Lachnospiraceae bacterium]|nr:spermidine/putrescine ABC transporter substrate-binding protein [Lachnospiraceae bacterium]